MNYVTQTHFEQLKLDCSRVTIFRENIYIYIYISRKHMPKDLLFADNRQCVKLPARDSGIGSYSELIQIQIRQNMETSHVRRI